MRQRCMEPNVRTYSASVVAYEKHSKMEVPLKLLHEMRQRRRDPDVVCYNAAISVSEKHNSFRSP